MNDNLSLTANNKLNLTQSYQYHNRKWIKLQKSIDIVKEQKNLHTSANKISQKKKKKTAENP